MWMHVWGRGTHGHMGTQGRERGGMMDQELK